MKKTWIAIITVFVILIVAVLVVLALQRNAFGKYITFAEFLEMSPTEQQAYMESYDNIEDFLNWYRLAEEEYKAEQKYTEVGDGGNINIGKGENGE